MDVSQDDFSRPEVEYRYRSHQNMLKVSPQHARTLGGSSQVYDELHVLPKMEIRMESRRIFSKKEAYY